MLHLFAGGEAWCGHRMGQCPFPEGPLFSFAVVPGAPRMDALRVSTSGTTAILDIHLPTGQPGAVLRCRLEASPHEVSRLQRHLHRALNHRQSGWAIAGMVLLVAVCGWVVGGEEGARW